jgi:hypothetical protein
VPLQCHFVERDFFLAGIFVGGRQQRQSGKVVIHFDGQGFVKSCARAVTFDFQTFTKRAKLAIRRLDLGVRQIAYKIVDDLLAAGYDDSRTWRRFIEGQPLCAAL